MATPPKKPTTRRTAAKTAGARRDAGSTATSNAADKASGTTGPTDAEKPASNGGTIGTNSKPPAPRRAAARKPAAASSTKAAAKSMPRNTTAKAKGATKRAKDKSPIGLKTAIAAGIGAVGAVATAALLTLRGSTPKSRTDPGAGTAADKPHQAKQADGTDSSKSFDAGIADEATVPQD